MKMIIDWFKNMVTPKRPRTYLDEFNSLINKMYRQYITKIEITDEELNNFITDIMLQFKKIAELRKETISGQSLEKISIKFVIMLDSLPRAFVDEHLKYELNNYLSNGLRPDYT